MKIFKRIISVLLIFTMILSMSITAFADFTDTKVHWANKEIDYLAEKTILNGYPDGSFKPQNNVTRVEIYKIVNKVMGYTQESEVNFLDVQKASWFYPEVAKGLEAGYISASLDGKLNPNIPATRQEVATIIGIAFGLPKDKSDSAKIFADANAIAVGSKGYISILKDEGYIAGYPDGNFKPGGSITRAEVSKMVNNITGEIANTPGTLSKNVEGNLLVNTDGVILRDMIIEGNLYLTEGVGNGSLKLENVTVKGQIINLSKKGKIITDAISVKSIKVTSKDDIREINTVKGTLQMLAEVEPTNATNKKINWSVVNEDGAITHKATINETGLLTAVENGKVKVKATSVSNPTINDKMEIEIKGQPLPSTIIFTEEGPLAKIIGDKDFTNKVTGGQGEGEITYISGTPSVATVNRTTGEVSILAVGTTVITASKAATKTHGETTNTYTINVTVNAVSPSTIIFTESGPISKILKDKAFTNKVTGGQGEGEITYTSETPAVATVNKTTGEVNILAAGTTIISARKAATKTHGEVINNYTVNVKRNPITPITKVEIIGKESVGSELTAEVTPKDATVTYQWKRMYNNPTTMEDIPGATTNKYTPSQKDARWMIVVHVVARGEYSGMKSVTTQKIAETPLQDPIINKAVTATNINAGQTLGNSTLSGSFKDISNKALTGKLVWSEPATIVNTTGDYRWIFKPDSDDYKWFRGVVSVKVNAAATNPDFAGGTGTLSDPYKVSSAEQLNNVRKYLDKHFIQTEDFYLNSGTFASGEGWVPIGNMTNNFTGTYNGQNKEIKSLTIQVPNANMVGIFGQTSKGAKLSNIIINNCLVRGNAQVGALVGYNLGEVLNCKIYGDKTTYIRGNNSVGGMVGYNKGTIDGCTGTTDYNVFGSIDTGGLVGTNDEGVVESSSSSCVTVGDNNVGGLVGRNEGGIYNSYTKNAHCRVSSGPDGKGKSWVKEVNIGGLVGANIGTISICSAQNILVDLQNKGLGGGLVGKNMGSICQSYSRVNGVRGFTNLGGEDICDLGGLVGYNSGTISQSFAKMNGNSPVKGLYRLGGLVGSNAGTIEDTYSTCSVDGHNDLGSLVGKNYKGSSISNSYAIGFLEKRQLGKINWAGIVGYNDGTVKDCYYNKETTKRDDTGKGNPKTTEEMSFQSTFKNWDFRNVWTMGTDRYPNLKWQSQYNMY